MSNKSAAARRKKPHYLGHRQRLRERFTRLGLDGWEPYEVLELLLTYAIPRRDLKPLAKELIARFQSLGGVLDAPYERLLEVEGIGPESARFLKLQREVLKFYLDEPPVERLVVTTPEKVAEYCRLELAGRSEEYFLALFLDNRHRLITSEILHHGTVDMSVVYPREVMARALHYRAAALLVAHNHPGGSPHPSVEDLRITRKLERAAATLGIRLLDHLIVADRQVVSLRERGDF